MQHSLLSGTRTLFEAGYDNFRQSYTQVQDSASDPTEKKLSRKHLCTISALFYSINYSVAVWLFNVMLATK